jgi:predicted RNA-binding Zn-ribbon protein involved in translation (DUF1610 family)
MSSCDFGRLINGSKTYKEVLAAFGLKNKGNNHRTVKKRILEEGIDCSHLLRSHDIMVGINQGRKRLLSDVMVVGSDYDRSSLKKRLIDNGLVRNECYECGQGPEWKGKTLVMVLDHINGISDDNRAENLRMLCPNCNSQQDTFCGKHNKNTRSVVCPSCGAKKSRFSKMCGKCSHIHGGLKTRKVLNRPSNQSIMALVGEEGWEAVGRRYGVSSQSIRGWVRKG